MHSRPSSLLGAFRTSAVTVWNPKGKTRLVTRPALASKTLPRHTRFPTRAAASRSTPESSGTISVPRYSPSGTGPALLRANRPSSSARDRQRSWLASRVAIGFMEFGISRIRCVAPGSGPYAARLLFSGELELRGQDWHRRDYPALTALLLPAAQSRDTRGEPDAENRRRNVLHDGLH